MIHNLLPPKTSCSAGTYKYSYIYTICTSSLIYIVPQKEAVWHLVVRKYTLNKIKYINKNK